MVRKRIIILDDEPLIPALIKEMILEDQELEISQVVTERNGFLESVRQNAFDAALIDISVGGREGGIELLQILKNQGFNLPSIMLSAHDERGYALKCLQAGARGYICKSCICADLMTGLKAVLAGDLFISGEKGKSILEQYIRFNGTPINTLRSL